MCIWGASGGRSEPQENSFTRPRPNPLVADLIKEFARRLDSEDFLSLHSCSLSSTNCLQLSEEILGRERLLKLSLVFSLLHRRSFRSSRNLSWEERLRDGPKERLRGRLTYLKMLYATGHW